MQENPKPLTMILLQLFVYKTSNQHFLSLADGLLFWVFFPFFLKTAEENKRSKTIPKASLWNSHIGKIPIGVKASFLLLKLLNLLLQ